VLNLFIVYINVLLSLFVGRDPGRFRRRWRVRQAEERVERRGLASTGL
jgi:hypothetical protein